MELNGVERIVEVLEWIGNTGVDWSGENLCVAEVKSDLFATTTGGELHTHC